MCILKVIKLLLRINPQLQRLLPQLSWVYHNLDGISKQSQLYGFYQVMILRVRTAAKGIKYKHSKKLFKTEAISRSSIAVVPSGLLLLVTDSLTLVLL